MIQFVNRNDLNVKKYDKCISESLQSNLFGFSWYLDICCTNWSALVLNDYESVMPIPFRDKYKIKYVYPPLWILQLGLYSRDSDVKLNDFLKVLQTNFKFVELPLNSFNSITNLKNKILKRSFQFLSIKDDYKSILNRYNRNRKRELVKAKVAKLVENWNDTPEKLIELFKLNIANRIHKINQYDFDNLLALMKYCLKIKTGDLLTIYSDKDELISAAFFIKNKNTVTQLVCASNLKNRDNGANTFSNDRAIFKYQKYFDIYNFGGSSMQSIAKYYKSFGAETEVYHQIKDNSLSAFLKLFRR